jgi:hypothetical protein
MINVDQEVKIIEEVLGQPYGVVPEAVEDSPEVRARMIKSLGIINLQRTNSHPVSIESLDKLLYQACYFCPLHLIIFPNGRKDKLNIYPKLHELVHGYLHQRYNWFNKIGEKLLALHSDAMGRENFGTIPKRLIEDFCLSDFLNEGIADYVAIQCEKAEMKKTGQNLSDRYHEATGIKREIIFSNPDSPIILPMPKHYKISKGLFNYVIQSTGLFNDVFSTFPKEIPANLTHTLVGFCRAISYQIGYLHVRCAVREKTSKFGSELENLIENRSATLSDFILKLTENFEALPKESKTY